MALIDCQGASAGHARAPLGVVMVSERRQKGELPRGLCVVRPSVSVRAFALSCASGNRCCKVAGVTMLRAVVGTRWSFSFGCKARLSASF